VRAHGGAVRRTDMTRIAVPLPRRLSDRTRKGSGLVEFALTVTLLLAFLFGIIDFGRAVYAYEFVTYAARTGARWACVRGSFCTNGSKSCTASATQIQTFVEGLAMAGLDPTQIAINTTSTYLWPGNASGCSAGSNNPGCPVKVRVTYNYASTIPFMRITTLPLNAVSEMVISQ